MQPLLAPDALTHAVFVDAEEVLGQIFIDGELHANRFQTIIESAMADASPPFRFFGEVVTLLAARGALGAAIELERIGHQLTRQSGARVMCAYDLRHLDDGGEGVHEVAGAHDVALPQIPIGVCGGRIVLLADDYADSRDLYKEVLKTRGYRVLTADGSAAVMQLARTWRPDVILMDPWMDDVSDGAVIPSLAKQSGLTHTRVVAFTAQAPENARERYLAAGFDGFIGKPCLPATLLHELEVLCDAGA